MWDHFENRVVQPNLTHQELKLGIPCLQIEFKVLAVDTHDLIWFVFRRVNPDWLVHLVVNSVRVQVTHLIKVFFIDSHFLGLLVIIIFTVTLNSLGPRLLIVHFRKLRRVLLIFLARIVVVARHLQHHSSEARLSPSQIATRELASIVWASFVHIKLLRIIWLRVGTLVELGLIRATSVAWQVCLLLVCMLETLKWREIGRARSTEQALPWNNLSWGCLHVYVTIEALSILKSKLNLLTMADSNIIIFLILRLSRWLHPMIVVTHEYNWSQEVIHSHFLLYVISDTDIPDLRSRVFECRGRILVVRIGFLRVSLGLAIVELVNFELWHFEFRCALPSYPQRCDGLIWFPFA